MIESHDTRVNALRMSRIEFNCVTGTPVAMESMRCTDATNDASGASSHASTLGKYCTRNLPPGDTIRSRTAAGSASRSDACAPSMIHRAASDAGVGFASATNGASTASATCLRSAARAGVSSFTSESTDSVRAIAVACCAETSSAATRSRLSAIETAYHDAPGLSSKSRRSQRTLARLDDCSSNKFD